MKLPDALLCIDCSELFESPARQCPSCTSANCFPISRWINRDNSDPEVIDAVIEFQNLETA